MLKTKLRYFFSGPTLELWRLRVSKPNYKPKLTPQAQLASKIAAVASHLERFVGRHVGT